MSDWETRAFESFALAGARTVLSRGLTARTTSEIPISGGNARDLSLNGVFNAEPPGGLIVCAATECSQRLSTTKRLRMPEWLTSTGPEQESLSVTLLFVRLVAALTCGLCVAGFYRVAHGRDRNATPGLATTLVLLSVLIALVSIVIGSSVARAFSLVGALSIVRFRTVVDDTRDTAFVIFTVVVGMAAGAGLFLAAIVGIPLVGGAAVALASWPGIDVSPTTNVRCILSVRLSVGRDPATLLSPVLDRYFSRYAAIATSTSKQGTALDLSYSTRLRDEKTFSAAVTELSQLDGVISAELKRD